MGSGQDGSGPQFRWVAAPPLSAIVGIRACQTAEHRHRPSYRAQLIRCSTQAMATRSISSTVRRSSSQKVSRLPWTISRPPLDHLGGWYCTVPGRTSRGRVAPGGAGWPRRHAPSGGSCRPRAAAAGRHRPRPAGGAHAPPNFPRPGGAFTPAPSQPAPCASTTSDPVARYHRRHRRRSGPPPLTMRGTRRPGPRLGGVPGVGLPTGRGGSPETPSQHAPSSRTEGGVQRVPGSRPLSCHTRRCPGHSGGSLGHRVSPLAGTPCRGAEGRPSCHLSAW